MYEWWFAPSNPSGGVMKYLKEPSQRAARGFEGPYSKPLLLTNMTTCHDIHLRASRRHARTAGWMDRWAGGAAGHLRGPTLLRIAG